MMTLLVCVWYDHRTPHVNPWHIFNIPRPFTAILFTSVGVLDAIMKIHLNACICSKRFKVEEEPLLLFNGGNFIVVPYFELAYLVHHFKSDMIQGGILQLILCSDTDIVKSGLKSIYSTIEMTHNDFLKCLLTVGKRMLCLKSLQLNLSSTITVPRSISAPSVTFTNVSCSIVPVNHIHNRALKGSADGFCFLFRKQLLLFDLS